MGEVFVWSASIFNALKGIVEFAAYVTVILACIKYLRK